MKGDDRVRFCDLCGKHVYNLAAIPTAESVEMIRKAEGSLCLRLYRRRDGTVLTADCPVGLREKAARRLRRLVQAAVALTAVWGLNAWVKAASGWPNGAPGPLAPVVRVFQDWWWGSCRVTTGEMVMTPAMPPCPPAATPAAPSPIEIVVVPEEP